MHCLGYDHEIEEEKADDGEDKDDKETAKDEESEEIGKDVDEVEDEIETDVEEKAEDGAKGVADGEIEKHEEDDKGWRIALESRIASLEEAIKGLARNPKETDEKTSSRLEELAKKYE